MALSNQKCCKKLAEGKVTLRISHPSGQFLSSNAELLFSMVLGVYKLYIGAFPVAQTVKNLPAVQETGVPTLGWEDLLEKEMATHSSILAWKIPWTE